MFLIDLLVAIVIALIFASILSSSSRKRGVHRAGAWPIFVFFFLLMLFATWAGGVWLVPFGPFIWGAYWSPFVVVGIIVWLLIAAIAWEPPRRLQKMESIAQDQQDEGVGIALTVFFWIVIIALIIGVFSHYWWVR
jgi:hypothetical protein